LLAKDNQSQLEPNQSGRRFAASLGDQLGNRHQPRLKLAGVRCAGLGHGNKLYRLGKDAQNAEFKSKQAKKHYD